MNTSSRINQRILKNFKSPHKAGEEEVFTARDERIARIAFEYIEKRAKGEIIPLKEYLIERGESDSYEEIDSIVTPGIILTAVFKERGVD